MGPPTSTFARARMRLPRVSSVRPATGVLRNIKTARGAYSSRVQRVLDSPGLEAPEGLTPERQLAIVEAFWKAMKKENSRDAASGKPGKNPHVAVLEGRLETDNDQTAPGGRLGGKPEFDVCICGGILGIMLGLSLLNGATSVCIVEKRAVQGRKQEWNISRQDLDVLTRLSLLAPEEIESCIVTRWEQDRIAFKGEKEDMWIQGALDLGVDPQRLIALLREKFLARGGTILEHHMFRRAHVYDDMARVELKPFDVSADSDDWNAADMNRGSSGSDDDPLVPSSSASREDTEQNPSVSSTHEPRSSLTCRLVVDCMGHYSPIVKQLRHGQSVEGMVIVVGGCMEEDDAHKTNTRNPNDYADLLVTIDDSEHDMQYFWEAFPAEGGKSKTVYMFAYADADQGRPSMTDIFDTYLTNLERYQGVPLDKILWKRVLMGGFPCYSKNVPLKPAFDRVMQAGDASAVQSPLSFGGFASMCRHLPRLQRGIAHALETDRLKKNDLALIHPYLPNLAVAWLFQRAMSLQIGQSSKPYISPDHINRLMMCNFRVMKFFGPSVTLPFVQDSFQAIPLGLVMFGMMFKDPITIIKVLFQVGLGMVMRWMAHYMCLVLYTVLHVLVSASGLDKVMTGYRAQRFFDALKWGSGLDHRGDTVDIGNASEERCTNAPHVTA